MVMQSLIDLAEIHIDLHSRWMPHEGQIPIGTAIFYDGFKKVFVCAGRSFGKSQDASYNLARVARENAGSTNFVFGPFIGQMKEIYWQSGLIHKLIPEEEIDSINNTDMRITLKNGSFIRVCGAENFEAFRGVKLAPGSICIIEEAKDIRAEFLSAFMPNLSVNDPILMMIGTPPNRENHFVHYMKLAQKDPKWFYYHAPSSVNPHVSRDFLADQKSFLIENGLEDVWQSEYEAIYTLGGHKSVFPMVPKMPIKLLDEAWPKDSNKWTLYIGFDPASTSIFAVEFFLFNEFSKKVIPVGEIYEGRAEYCTARKMFDVVNEKIAEFKARGIKNVEMVYDSAAAWFRNEISGLDLKGEWWICPSDKSSGLQGEISCWRGVLAHGHFEWTDAVPKLRWEMENYVLDEKGKMPDKDDHAWQAGAYILKAMGFDFTLALEPVKMQKEERRAFSIEEEQVRTSSYEEID